eukprot:TRINITY_DN2839_c0_g3_i2.p1 TRINITY_DN2839_c0_g3~~TRINITY_DN2839_c0_g3_i2.p1  ORF type:complete len:409 (-),score=91.70 TRINITY_DN2839_c0_g3_i2:139-1365(-)
MLRRILTKTSLPYFVGRNETALQHTRPAFTTTTPKLVCSRYFSTVPNKKEGETQHTQTVPNYPPQQKPNKEEKENNSNNPKIKKKFHTKKPHNKSIDTIPKSLTQKCTTVSTAKKYDFNALTSHFTKNYTVTHITNDIIHISLAPEGGGIERHVFFFDEGLVSAWGLTNEEETMILNEIKPFQIDPRKQVYEEEINFEFKPSASTLLNDLIVIGNSQNQRDMILDMLAFSSGLARSVKLSLIEQNIDHIVPPLQALVDELSKTGKLEMNSSSEIELNKKMGEFLGVGSEMYLFENIVETPEIYWDDSRREDFWDSISYEMEIKLRISHANTKVKQAMEIIRAVQNFQTEQHSRKHEKRANRLEIIIIFLIFVEVIFGSPSFWRNELKPLFRKEGEEEENKKDKAKAKK